MNDQFTMFLTILTGFTVALSLYISGRKAKDDLSAQKEYFTTWLNTLNNHYSDELNVLQGQVSENTARSVLNGQNINTVVEKILEKKLL